jgi:hypothetical protein
VTAGCRKGCANFGGKPVEMRVDSIGIICG